MKISENVIKLDSTKGSYAYAVLGNGVTLVDTGLPGRGASILKELASYGIRQGDIRTILITHNDIDHIGNMAFLQDRSGCDIQISRDDYPQIVGTGKRYGIKRVVGAIMKTKAPKSIHCFSNDTAGNFQVLPTPGHTPGHVCFRCKGVLFAGDLIWEKNGKPAGTPGFTNWNSPMLADSLRKLQMDGVEWICPAHGEPIRLEDRDIWNKFIGTLS